MRAGMVSIGAPRLIPTLAAIISKGSSNAVRKTCKVTSDLVLSIVMLAALALLGGAFVLWRRTGEIRNPALMVLLALIAIGNVLIWTVPTPGGTTPLEQAQKAG